jgi:Beta/Gamma crystallin/Peptidase inhibitor family I36
MKRTYFTLALCATLIGISMVPGEAVSQSGRAGRDQVCIYEHAGYGGWEQCFGVGEDIRDLGNLRNGISSVRIQGRAEITLYEHPNFNGREVTLSRSVSDMNREVGRFWNDEVDSLRVSAPGFRGGRPGGRMERSADRICVYQHVGFQGNSQCFDAGDDVRELRSIGWNDGISSIRVFGRGRVAVYEDNNFQGQRLIVEGDIPDLTYVNSSRGHWNDRISSLRVGGSDRRGNWRD